MAVWLSPRPVAGVPGDVGGVPHLEVDLTWGKQDCEKQILAYLKDVRAAIVEKELESVGVGVKVDGEFRWLVLVIHADDKAHGRSLTWDAREFCEGIHEDFSQGR